MVVLTSRHGLTPEIPFGFAVYGIFLCGAIGDLDRGYAFGQLAQKTVDRLEARETWARTNLTVNNFIRYWKEPVVDTLPVFLKVFQVGQETGDFEFAGFAIFAYAGKSLLIGRELNSLEKDIVRYGNRIRQLKQEAPYGQVLIFHKAVLVLMDQFEEPVDVVGEIYNEEKILSEEEKTGNDAAIFLVQVNELLLCTIFGEYSQAIEVSLRCQANIEAGIGLALLEVTAFWFYDAIARAAQCPIPSKKGDAKKQRKVLKRLKKTRGKFRKWARHCEANHLHTLRLIEAEIARLQGRLKDAREFYDQAIEAALEYEYLNIAALAQERAAYLYQEQGRIHNFKNYLRDAHYTWQKWGARAKARQLEKLYPNYLQDSIISPYGKTPLSSTTKEIVGFLDLASVLKASQAISTEMVAGNLAAKVLEVVIENAGAHRGLLLLKRKGKLEIVAEGTVDKVIIPRQNLTIEENSLLAPLSIVNLAYRTKEVVALDDVSSNVNFSTDPYITARKTRSVHCQPILHGGECQGLLYLENDSPNTFSQERSKVLKLLSGQIAISIANSELYETLEEKVEQRTEQLEEAKKKAEVASEAKGAFLANMSHELRTPLNAILGYAQIMNRDNLSARQRENLSVIYRSGEHLLTLINQVLNLSKIEAGKEELEEKSFDLHSLLIDLEDMFRVKAENKGLELLFEYSKAPQYIYTDEMKLRQILINLLNNALKFTWQGKVITRVDKSTTDSPDIIAISFEVEDTGSGIKANEMDTLFKAFTQTEVGRQSQEGTGLGLSISHKFVQMMGGNITVTSEVGKGSTFRFHICAQQRSAVDIDIVSATRKVISLEPNQIKYRLLVVDDKPVNRQILVKLLAPLGFDIQEAENGKQAIEMWKEFSPHLIWMDMRMPVMDGYEAIAHIKNADKDKRTIIVALTASVLEEEKAIILATGSDHFLRKPFTEDEIFGALHKHLGVRYIYEKEEIEKQHTKTLRADGLNTLPLKLRENLKKGAEEADVSLILKVVAEIRKFDAALADTLTHLANQYEYDDILLNLE